MRIRVDFSGRGYPPAGSLPEHLVLPDAARLDDALELVASGLPADQQLPGSCLVTVSGRHLGTLADHQDCPLADGDELLLIAPVAGG